MNNKSRIANHVARLGIRLIACLIPITALSGEKQSVSSKHASYEERSGQRLNLFTFAAAILPLPISLETSCPAGGIEIAPGASIQEAVNAAPSNTSFCLKAGVHKRQSVSPRTGQKFYGEIGTVMDGEGAAEFAFQPTANDVTVTGIIVTRYMSPSQTAAVQGEGASGWTIERVEARSNNAWGLSVGSNGKIINCLSHHNEQGGITAGGSNILIENNELAFNNLNNKYDIDWEAGGLKITETRGLTIRGNRVHGNNGSGLWTDEDVYDAVIENNSVEGNRGAGIFHEISYAAKIRDNTVRNNGLRNKGWFWDADIQIPSSQDVEVYGNKITTRDGGTAIILIDQNRGPDEMGGIYKARNNFIHGNDIIFLGEGNAGGISDADAGDENYDIIENGNNRFDRNRYHGNRANVSFAWGHQNHTWSAFRALGQETNGSFE